MKLLEWTGPCLAYAANPWGGYYISDRAGPNQDWDYFGWRQSSRGDCDESDVDYPTMEAAKSAAQADYQARILSALSIPTDAMSALEAVISKAEKRGRDAALEEALAAVSEVFNGFQNRASDAIKSIMEGNQLCE